MEGVELRLAGGRRRRRDARAARERGAHGRAQRRLGGELLGQVGLHRLGERLAGRGRAGPALCGELGGGASKEFGRRDEAAVGVLRLVRARVVLDVFGKLERAEREAARDGAGAGGAQLMGGPLRSADFSSDLLSEVRSVRLCSWLAVCVAAQLVGCVCGCAAVQLCGRMAVWARLQPAQAAVRVHLPPPSPAGPCRTARAGATC